MDGLDDSAEPAQGRGHVIPLAEFIDLSAFLENQQAAEGRRESQLSFIERAATIALHVVDRLRETQENDVSCNTGESCVYCALQANDIVVENFVVEIGADSDHSDTEELKKSPELLLTTMENVNGVHISDPLQTTGAIKVPQPTLREILQKLGLILYQIFSRGKIPPSSICSESESNGGPNLPADVSIPDRTKSRVRERFSGGAVDEEHQGAEKGGQKRSIGDACKIFRRVHLSDHEDLLSELCVPASISILLKDLIGCGDGNDYAFQSLKCVSDELRQIVARPHVFLDHGEDTGQMGVLDFGESIVGRTEELICLLEAAARIESAGDDQSLPHTLFLVKGGAGLGKSYLVESVRGFLMSRGWIYLSCKFDRLMRAQSLSTIASAFDEFFQHVASLANEGRDVDAILSSVQEAVSSSGIVVLSELIPSLFTLYPAVFASIVRDDCSDSSEEDIINSEVNNIEDTASMDDEELIGSAETLKNRLHYLFRMLVHTLSRPEQPLFLFVDDLQWIDESGIQLLSSLLTDSDHLNNGGEGSQRLLVVCSYRDSEVDESHIISKYLEKFNSSASVSVRNIHLDAISKSDANVLVSQALRLPVRQTRALSDTLYTKTLGNPLHLRVFMKSMVDDKLITYSLVHKRWMWNLEALQATSIDDNVAELLTRKLRVLPEDSQKALKIASCFGMHVDESSLRILLADEILVPRSLELARQEGILEREGLTFAHDMIQQAAYDLMSPVEKGNCHYIIGVLLVTHIASSIESHDFHPVTFAAAIQINKAKSLAAIDSGDQSMCLEFATVNLKAGERSMELSDFPSALGYIEYGISFLPETRWDTNYDLSLRLYELACLACYINARTDNVTVFLGEILENARYFEDRLNGLYVIVQSLTSSGKLKESMDKIFFILDELGESFPESEVAPAAIQDALMSAKSSLDGYSKEDFVAAPRLNNKRMHWAVKLMAHALPYIYQVMPSHLPLIGCRIVDLSVKHGVSSETAFGLCTYGLCCVAYLRDIDEGYRWGKIALSLLKSLGESAEKLVPKVKLLCHHMIFFWVEPLQSSSNALLQCHREALLVGDIEYASHGAQFYCVHNILSGIYLPTVEKECTSLALKMVHLKQLPSCLTQLTSHQLVRRLIGSKENPFDILGGFVDNECELLQYSLSTGKYLLAQTIYFNRLFVAFFFKKYEEAAEYARIYRIRQEKVKGTYRIYFVFYEGLTAFHFARHSSSDEATKWFQIGEGALSSFRTWSKHSAWNWENKLLLLEAECLFSEGEIERAEEKYTLAIESARRHRFVHEEGLSNDLFSFFHITNGRIDKAKSHVSEARACYVKWGAFALVEHLDSS